MGCAKSKQLCSQCSKDHESEILATYCYYVITTYDTSGSMAKGFGSLFDPKNLAEMKEGKRTFADTAKDAGPTLEETWTKEYPLLYPRYLVKNQYLSNQSTWTKGAYELTFIACPHCVGENKHLFTHYPEGFSVIE